MLRAPSLGINFTIWWWGVIAAAVWLTRSAGIPLNPPASRPVRGCGGLRHPSRDSSSRRDHPVHVRCRRNAARPRGVDRRGARGLARPLTPRRLPPHRGHDRAPRAPRAVPPSLRRSEESRGCSGASGQPVGRDHSRARPRRRRSSSSSPCCSPRADPSFEGLVDAAFNWDADVVFSHGILFAVFAWFGASYLCAVAEPLGGDGSAGGEAAPRNHRGRRGPRARSTGSSSSSCSPSCATSSAAPSTFSPPPGSRTPSTPGAVSSS